LVCWGIKQAILRKRRKKERKGKGKFGTVFIKNEKRAQEMGGLRGGSEFDSQRRGAQVDVGIANRERWEVDPCTLWEGSLSCEGKTLKTGAEGEFRRFRM